MTVIKHNIAKNVYVAQLSTPGIISASGISINGTDVTENVLNGGGSNSKLLHEHNTGTGNQTTIINLNSLDPDEDIEVGIIGVKLSSSDSSGGSIAYYSRGKIGNSDYIYTVNFEQNKDNSSRISLDTETSDLKIITTKDFNCKIKLLSIF